MDDKFPDRYEALVESMREFRHKHERFKRLGNQKDGKDALRQLRRIYVFSITYSKELQKEVAKAKKQADVEVLDKLLNIKK